MDRHLRYSEIASWLACRFRHHLGYEQNLRLRRDKVYIKLGDGVHVGLAAGLQKKSPDEALDGWFLALKKEVEPFGEEALAEATETYEKALGIAHRSLSAIDLGHKWDTHYLEDVPMVEFAFETEMPGWPGMTGTVDWVAKELETGHLWLWDHKVRSSLQPDDSEEFNLQMSVYQRMLRPVAPVVGSIAHQIRNALPKEPKQNKNGSMSRVKIASDWETYKAALIQNNLDPEEYQDMKPKLDEVEFYRYSRAFRSDLEVDNIWEMVVMVAARDIPESRSNLIDIGNGPMVPPRNINHMACKICRMQQLCWAEIRGHDVEFVRNTHYIDKDATEEPFEPPELDEDVDTFVEEL